MWNNYDAQLPIGASCPLEAEANDFNFGRPGHCNEDCQLRKLYECLREQPMDFNRGNADVNSVSAGCNCWWGWGCPCRCCCHWRPLMTVDAADSADVEDVGTGGKHRRCCCCPCCPCRRRCCCCNG